MRHSFRSILLSSAVALATLIIETTPTLAQDNRPTIVFIHGRNQMEYSDLELDTMWFNAFQRGLSRAGAAGLVGRQDYTLVKYQDLYKRGVRPVCPTDITARRESTLAAVAKRDTAAVRVEAARVGLTRSTLRRLVASGRINAAQKANRPLSEESLRREAAEIATADAESARAEAELATARTTLAAAELELTSAEQQADAAEAALDLAWPPLLKITGDKILEFISGAIPNFPPAKAALLRLVFTDTERYLTDRRTHCATNARLDAAMSAAGQRPVVLVAHSMGSLVSYARLHQIGSRAMGGAVASDPGSPSPQVARFVTLGSQLGVESVLHDLVGAMKPRPVPQSIRTWVNLRGEHDWVSPRKVAGQFENRPEPPFGFAEYLIPTKAGDPHDISGYLENPGTVRVILHGWCNGFTPAARPAGCASFARDIEVGDGGARTFRRGEGG